MKVPKNRTLYRYAVDTFSDLLNQVQERSTAYRCNDPDVNAWNRFVDTFTKRKITFTKGFIKDFCEYGMQSWFNPETPITNKLRVRFSWVFSDKAIQRWDALNSTIRNRCVRGCLKTEFKIEDRVKPKLKKAYVGLRPVEERFKKEFYNTRRGLSWCVVNTTLFNHKSVLCTNCDFRTECKEILRQNYIKIYNIRGYSDNET